MVYSEIVRALPTRPDIKELQYSGARFSRGAIARLGQRLQSRYPTHKFQILLPMKTGNPVDGHQETNQPASSHSWTTTTKHNYQMTQTLIILNDS
ncbi:uncharacterized protein OCT59_024165 [Rhizophagus irregularis]|uniref:uncharacterized protein n=1 Tax=Rhizophagus irregularis TaxID=588596 RepID=UPI000CB986AA|nr:hypothetical protein OCT59_024165 [Rhizophagus irregularis]